MSTQDSSVTAAGRPLRADARRNREKLLALARARLAGSGDSFALESIARDAGVGIGTLYRHFPTRAALVEAVYAVELDELTASTSTSLEQMTPADALRQWVARYAAFMSAKRGMVDALRAGPGERRFPTSNTRERITGAIAPILEAGKRDGSLRDDIDPDDLIALLLGVFVATRSNEDPQQVERLLALILDAVRA